MAKAAANAVSSAKSNPTGTALGILTGGQSTMIDGALKATGNKSITDSLKDPFGSKAAAAEQDARYDDALAAIDGKMLNNNSQSTTKSVSDTVGKTSSTSNTVNDSNTSNLQVSKTTFDPKSTVEKRLERDQLSAYAQQKKLVADQEKDILAREGLQNDSRDRLSSVLSGDAFELSGSEDARINRLRDANIGASSDAVNLLLNERLAEVEADAAARGVRGQAFSQLQGDAIGEAARNLNTATLDANRIAGQQAIDMPGQRVGIQASTANTNSAFADSLQQQAIENNNMLQDPTLKKQLQDERLAGGTNTTSGTSNTSGSSSTIGSTKSKNTNATNSNTSSTGQQEIDPTQLLAAKAGSPGGKTATIVGNQNAVGTAGEVVGLVGQVGGMLASDEDGKKNISQSKGEKRLQELLDSIGTSSYEYKDKENGGGEYVSPMAQELEKTEIGEDMVIDTPNGKMVDYGRGEGTALSAAALLNKRLSAIEEMLKEKSKPKKRKAK